MVEADKKTHIAAKLDKAIVSARRKEGLPTASIYFARQHRDSDVRRIIKGLLIDPLSESEERRARNGEQTHCITVELIPTPSLEARTAGTVVHNYLGINWR